MSELARGAKLLTRFVAQRLRPQIAEAERELNRLIAIVDAFYERLGRRNWIFHDSLPADDIEQLLAETEDPSSAERRLISLYRQDGFLKHRILMLQPHGGMRARRHLIDRALKHYDSDEFDSCALQLVAVMDGFVNDFDAEHRKGLHARDADEMVAWDSIVGHHFGLTHAMEAFRKTIKKRIDEEVFELHRNGIVHGTVVNFDNDVVATKAWNMLFAVADWATATTKAAEPQEPKPTLRETLASIRNNAAARRRDDEHVAETIDHTHDLFAADEAVNQASRFLGAWERGQWGIVTEYMPPVLRERRSDGRAVSETKASFEWHEINSWNLTSVTYELPGVAVVRGTATLNGEQHAMELRMVHLDHEGDRTTLEDSDARWHVAIWAPRRYFEQAADAAK